MKSENTILRTKTKVEELREIRYIAVKSYEQLEKSTIKRRELLEKAKELRVSKDTASRGFLGMTDKQKLRSLSKEYFSVLEDIESENRKIESSKEVLRKCNERYIEWSQSSSECKVYSLNNFSEAEKEDFYDEKIAESELLDEVLLIPSEVTIFKNEALLLCLGQ